MSDLPFSYYLITDRKACAPRPLADVVEEACSHGFKAVQLREKDLSDRSLFRLAKQLRNVTRHYNALLFINDRVDIALTTGADGIHCRENSLSPEVIKKLSNDLIIGASVHSVERAEKMARGGADFLLFGPVFYTPSKASYGEPQGTKQLKQVVERVKVPVLAVGGITPGRAPSCLAAGADGLAGISSVMRSSNIEETAANWKKVLAE